MNDPFANSFMQPAIEYADYWEVETSAGTEIVLSDVVDVTNVGVLHDMEIITRGN